MTSDASPAPPAHPRDDRPGGAAAAFPRGQRVLLWAGFLLLVALRAPRAWVHGRFFAEEGTIFLAYAWHRPAWDALWRSFGGYLNVAANGWALVDARLVQAGLLSLEHAPYLTMIVALLFQSIPAAILLTARDRWLGTRWAVVAALLAIVLAPRTEEVFFNILHIQFHLALAAALILALRVPRSRGGRAAHAAILFAAPLCGPSAIILWPFLAARAALERDCARIAQAIAMGVAVAIQLLVFFQPSPVRGDVVSAATLGGMLFVRLLVLPILGAGPANVAGDAMFASMTAGGHGWWAAAGAAAIAGLLLVWHALRRSPASAAWLVLPAGAIALVSFGGGMIATPPSNWFSVGAAERYNFLPIALLTLAMIALARQPGAPARRTCATILALVLASGAITYRKPIRMIANGPVWPAQVAAWRLDRDRPLAGWPAEWTMDLSDRSRPCPPRDTADPAAVGPSYCESAWLLHVRDATARELARRP